jgi:hypothetical protein
MCSWQAEKGVRRLGFEKTIGWCSGLKEAGTGLFSSDSIVRTETWDNGKSYVSLRLDLSSTERSTWGLFDFRFVKYSLALLFRHRLTSDWTITSI